MGANTQNAAAARRGSVIPLRVRNGELQKAECYSSSTMNADEIAQLLWQSESETLDFKRDQYPFDGVTDEQRSELLKDILAFANSWRSAPARILIGVDEVKHGRSVPVGTEHLTNRSLQTFVNSK
ncbi:MAG TPA: RNA-binding domain-containing protein, partial [Acidobacteriaceae bacterium]